MKTDIQIAQEAEMKPHQRGGGTVLVLQKMILNFMENIKQNFPMNLWDRVKDNAGWKTCTCNSNQSNSGRRREDYNHL